MNSIPFPATHKKRALSILGALQHSLHHGIAHSHGILEPRLEELLRRLEPVLPRLKVTQRNALRPPPRREREFEIIGAVRVVLHRRPQRVVEQLAAAEEVLRDAEPQPEQWRRANHVVVGHDAQLRPAVHHSQQAEVVVCALRLRLVLLFSEGEALEKIRVQQGAVRPLGAAVVAKHLFLRGEDASAEGGGVAFEHELVEVRDGAGELGDLLAGLGVEDREAGVDVPLLGVDAQHNVDLDVLYAADVARHFPGELGVCVPGFAHGEEGGVGDGLGVGGDAVVLEGREVDVLGAEDGEDGLDSCDGGGGRAVADDDEWLVARVDVGAVEGMAGDDLNVGGEVTLKGCDLGGLA